MSIVRYGEQIYAGVLGKIIGVYMGRPVEGWTYDAIRSRFGLVDRFVAEETGAPFIVPDDDISGTFVFWRALEDSGYDPNLSAEAIGEAWLNYIIEDRIVLWWGGLSRSTEHSAFLRLKAGIKPPRSGSGELNGMAIAEAIGAQIFIDTWAMANPGDPERAAAMARKAAIVSHDGIAVEAAVHLAALEAMAFDERDIHVLLREGRRFIGANQYGRQLSGLLDDLYAVCASSSDWRVTRDWIETNHNYAKYLGNCPMVPNHLGLLMAFWHGGDDFRRSVAIAASAGWDTDCNAGNVGCLNGIRLGLDSIDADAELRRPVADRMFVVSSDGGECLTDALRESRRLLVAAARLRGEDPAKLGLPATRYAFERRGSVQGFLVHPGGGFSQADTELANPDGAGLRIRYRGVSHSQSAKVSVCTYVDPSPKAAADTSYFEVYASPSLYSSQDVIAVVHADGADNPKLRFFIDYYDKDDRIATIQGNESFEIRKGDTSLTWRVPDTGGRAIYRLGIEILSEKRRDGEITLRSLDWGGAPRHFKLGKSAELSPGISPFVTRTKWMMAFMNSTRHSGPDYLATLAISHPEENGLMTIGGATWDDYVVESKIQFVHADLAGMVVRSKGHRRYYAAAVKDGRFCILRRRGDEVVVLAESTEHCADGEWRVVRFEAKADGLSLRVDGREIAKCRDDEYSSGAAGFVVSGGAIVVDGFLVEASQR
jgi:ADP-ribosylglycohydrolase